MQCLCVQIRSDDDIYLGLGECSRRCTPYSVINYGFKLHNQFIKKLMVVSITLGSSEPTDSLKPLVNYALV
jgi:hypothetical protein